LVVKGIEGTMTREEYHELLKDGRWQRKRLEIMQRDDFKCRECGTTNDLNVHHIRYIAGRKPWEYDNGDLVTLCGSCHKATHDGIVQEQQTFIDNDCQWRAIQNSGLLLYYKKIGNYRDVITMQITKDYGMCMDFHHTFFWRDVLPYSESWNFAGCCSANPVIIGLENCKEVRNHIWNNDPDEILTKEQFENVREGFKIDKERFEYEGNLDTWWVIMGYYFHKAEKRYNEIEKENEKLSRHSRTIPKQFNNRDVWQPSWVQRLTLHGIVRR
jgi:hypothetical protein